MKKIVNSGITLPIFWIISFLLTHWPKEEMPETPSIPYIDKVVHFSIFLILGFLLSHRVRTGGNLKKKLFIVFGILAAYAAFDELTQPIVERTTELLDWIADVCGALTGFALYHHWTKKIVQASEPHD